ncbi:MAG: hypothetical protein RIT27_1050 [Pseudomonadota bacterium]|jgi:Xaa-Pro aminopeptidase
MITQEEYRFRRQQFMQAIGKNNIAILRSAPIAIAHNDVEYPYRQDSDFFYLTGLNEPNAVAVFLPSQRNHKFILFVEPRDLEKEQWVGRRLGMEGVEKILGANKAFSIEKFEKIIPNYIEKTQHIFYHFGRDEKFNQLILELWRKILAKRSRTGFAPQSIIDLSQILHSMRQIKRPLEIETMKKAVEITALAHQKARTIAQAGCFEYQVQAEIENTFRQYGADGWAYPSIVAAGENACVLHYTDNNYQMKNGDLLLIDAGCAFQYYNADVTRTFPINKKFSTEQKLLYELVLQIQLNVIEQIKPQVPYDILQKTAIKTITEGLKELGLLRGHVDDLIEQKAYKPFYMHNIGHWLGIDVHDVGDYKIGKEHKQLETGNVLTVEPGIYVSPQIKPAKNQPDIPEKWRGIGIRIEDNVLVTNNGHDILTSAIPKTVDDIEHYG